MFQFTYLGWMLKFQLNRVTLISSPSANAVKRMQDEDHVYILINKLLYIVVFKQFCYIAFNEIFIIYQVLCQP